MNPVKRPTSVTAIGWVWIALGGFMIFTSCMAFFIFLAMWGVLSEEPAIPDFVKYYPVLCVANIFLGAAALVSAINFLKLKAWARTVLEVVNWIVLVFLIGFMGVWVFFWNFLTSSAPDVPEGFTSMGIAGGVFVLLFYGVPVVIAIKCLRGSTVKEAIRTAEQDGALAAPSIPPLPTPRV